jgi:hypothetical protein
LHELTLVGEHALSLLPRRISDQAYDYSSNSKPAALMLPGAKPLSVVTVDDGRSFEHQYYAKVAEC